MFLSLIIYNNLINVGTKYINTVKNIKLFSINYVCLMFIIKYIQIMSSIVIHSK